jgi:hypothetical protein
MKYFVILFCCSFFLPLYGQKSFKTIKRAEQKFENGNSKRALKLLLKAEQNKDVFCGTAAFQKDNAIGVLRARIYVAAKAYSEARRALQQPHVFGQNVDSLTILSYQLEFGADVLKQNIDKGLDNSYISYNESLEIYYVCVPITKDLVIQFNTFFFNHSIEPDRRTDYEHSFLRRWVTKFRESSLYEWVKT